MAKNPKTATRKSTTPADETKAAKFSRLASARVSKAVKAIKQIGNLSGNGYEKTPEQITAIKSHLVQAVNSTLAKFDKNAPKEDAAEIKI